MLGALVFLAALGNIFEGSAPKPPIKPKWYQFWKQKQYKIDRAKYVEWLQEQLNKEANYRKRHEV